MLTRTHATQTMHPAPPHPPPPPHTHAHTRFVVLTSVQMKYYATEEDYADGLYHEGAVTLMDAKGYALDKDASRPVLGMLYTYVCTCTCTCMCICTCMCMCTCTCTRMYMSVYAMCMCVCVCMCTRMPPVAHRQYPKPFPTPHTQHYKHKLETHPPKNRAFRRSEHEGALLCRRVS